MISALTGYGVDSLKEELLLRIRRGGALESEGVIISNARHKEALDCSIDAMDHAQSILSEGEPVECAAHHFRQAQESLGAITGETSTEDVLNEIFSTFCIGK